MVQILFDNRLMITLYGIPNCDTVKKSRAWLSSQGLHHTFHDFKKQGVPQDRLQGWVKALGVDTLLNRRGTTWRQLDAQTQAQAQNEAGAQHLMQTHASLIKRPVVEWTGRGGPLTVGFDADTWLRMAEQAHEA